MYICNTKEKDMRQILLLLISGLFLVSCTEQYNIAGNSTVPVLDGRMLYLKVTPNGIASENIDSCKVIHGRFNFFGAVDSVVLAQVCMDNENVMPIVLENGKLTSSQWSALQILSTKKPHWQRDVGSTAESYSDDAGRMSNGKDWHEIKQESGRTQ